MTPGLKSDWRRNQRLSKMYTTLSCLMFRYDLHSRSSSFCAYGLIRENCLIIGRVTCSSNLILILILFLQPWLKNAIVICLVSSFLLPTFLGFLKINKHHNINNLWSLSVSQNSWCYASGDLDLFVSIFMSWLLGIAEVNLELPVV